MRENIRVVPNLCLWQDLLGFGKSFQEYDWKMTKEVTDNLFRLKNIQEKISVYSPLGERVFILNDGVGRTFDIPSNVNLIIGWIQYVISDFYILNTEDKSRGFPGMRGVLSFGERAELIERDILTKDQFILTSKEKKKEYRRDPIVFTPRQMQMNTAFSKAFLIEESGSKKNVSGCNLYIDESVFEQLEIIINNIKYDRFGMIEPYLGRNYLQYNYLAKYDKNESRREFVVVASIDGKEECSWDYFRLTMKDEVIYNNEERSINTRLYTPYSIQSSLNGPSRDNETKWCVDDTHVRSGLSIGLFCD